MKYIKKFYKSINNNNYKAICLIVLLFSILSFIYTTKNILIDVVDDKGIMHNTFSIWYLFNHSLIMDWLVFLSPILICYGALYQFYNEVNKCVIIDNVLRQKYNKFTLRNIIFTYISAYLPFFILSFISFLICFLLYPHNINIIDGVLHSSLSNFKYNISNNYLVILISFITLLFYTSTIVNICLTLIKKIKKFNLFVILVFIIFNISNFIISNLFYFISRLVHENSILYYIFTKINLYGGINIDYNIIFILIESIIFFIISFIPVVINYRNKEYLCSYKKN